MAHYCKNCNGTGADPKKTEDALRERRVDKGSYIRCWECNGNGLDPAEHFTWSANTPREIRPETGS